MAQKKIQRNQLDPLNDGRFNVLDYGAVGDDLTESATAIQAAIDAASAAGGGEVFFPAGTYKISVTINLKNKVSLIGAGASDSSGTSCIRQSNTTAHAILMTNTTVSQGNDSIEKLRIQGPASGSGHGIYLKNTGNAGNHPFFGYMSFRDLFITGFGGYGFNAESLIVSVLERVVCRSNGSGFFFNGDADALNTYNTVSTSVSLLSCFAHLNTTYGFNIDRCIYLSLVSCASDSNGTNYLIDTSQDVALYSCGSEYVDADPATPGNSFKIDACTSVGLHNCYSYKNKNFGVWVTGNSTGITLQGVHENSPVVGAVNSIKVDAGSFVSSTDNTQTTAKSIAGTELILSDGQGNVTMPGTISVSDYAAWKSRAANATIFSIGSYGVPVNYLGLEAAPTANGPSVIAYGTDVNIGVNFIPKGTGRLRANFVDIPTVSSADTLTNKRIQPRVYIVGSAATLSANHDEFDLMALTALDTNLTVGDYASTYTQGERKALRLKDNGVARTITWNAIYRAIGVTLPTTTVVNKTVYIEFMYNATDNKWDVFNVKQEA